MTLYSETENDWPLGVIILTVAAFYRRALSDFGASRRRA
jgi:hypothetical protein